MKTTKQNLALVLLLAGISPLPAQIVTNGDFELPELQLGVAVYSPANAGWLWEGFGGMISPPGFVASNVASFMAPNAPSGTQISFVESSPVTNSFMAQTLSFPKPGLYRLQYQDAGRPYLNIWGGGNVTYQVLLDTTVIAEASTTDGQPFSAKEYTFVSTAGQHVLKFMIVAPTTFDNTAFFDAINVDLVFELAPLDIRVSQVELCWDTRPNLWYQVQYRSSLDSNHWTPFSGWLQGTGGRFCTNDAIVLGQPKRFYQVAITNAAPLP